jgi:antitoxin component YwqK of YwqJK toxin-antitoxin module
MNRILIFIMLAALITACSQKKVIESTYENGNPRIVKYYHKKAGELILEREVVYYDNEQVKIDGGYENEQRNGEWKAWYKNGNLWSTGYYKNGKRNGKGIAYHENGKKYIEGLYRDDLRVGVWQFYDTTGTLIKEVNFDLVPDSGENDSAK